MTYKPKIHGCSYRSSDGQCVHKGCFLYKPKGKKHKSCCPYNKPESCELYNEWVEQRKIDSDCIETPVQPSNTKGEDN